MNSTCSFCELHTHLVDGTRHESLMLWLAATTHGVGLACACLAITEQAHMEAIQCTLHQLRHTVKHLHTADDTEAATVLSRLLVQLIF